MRFSPKVESRKIYIFLFLSISMLANSQSYYDQFISKANLGLNIIAGLVKVKPEKNEPFNELRLTNEDKANITFIIKNMGEQGKLWLLVHKSELNEIGDKIYGVHPLKFITVIANSKYLKKTCMPVILNDYFKKKNFIEGLGANMTREAQKGKIKKYMPDFLAAINFSQDHSKNLLEYTKTRNWEAFIWYIVNN